MTYNFDLVRSNIIARVYPKKHKTNAGCLCGVREDIVLDKYHVDTINEALLVMDKVYKGTFSLFPESREINIKEAIVKTINKLNLYDRENTPIYLLAGKIYNDIQDHTGWILAVQNKKESKNA